MNLINMFDTKLSLYFDLPHNLPLVGCVVIVGAGSCSSSFPSVHCIGSTVQETISCSTDMQAQQTDNQSLALVGISHAFIFLFFIY